MGGRFAGSGAEIRDCRSVVARRLAWATLGRGVTLERNVLSLRGRSNSYGVEDRGLSGDMVAAGLAYVSMGGLAALREWLAWRRGPGQV